MSEGGGRRWGGGKASIRGNKKKRTIFIGGIVYKIGRLKKAVELRLRQATRLNQKRGPECLHRGPTMAR